MTTRYLTVKAENQAEYIEKKSRFIGYVKPVETETEALDFIKTIRAKHYDATHNCYAYQIGENNQLQRSSDAGEPAGTAGRPILEVIKKSDLKNTCVVVTRYFGGILLGAGGLVRAYSHAAQEGIKAAGIVEKIAASVISLTLDYSLWGKIENYLVSQSFDTRNVIYLEKITAQVIVPLTETARFKKTVVELGSDQIQILDLAETAYLTKDV
ncbi:MAG: YigZ family protein [Bacillota bacterium]|jgi:uncharacterized YigZ family protein